MNQKKREEIIDRYYGVLAERNCQEEGSKSYKQLSYIAKLILSELTIGNHPRHIMFCIPGSGYDYKLN